MKKVSPISEALAATKQIIVPGIILWIIALGILIGYYQIPAFMKLLGFIADLKARYNYLYAMIATALFGGIIPYAYLRIRRSTRHMAPLSHLPFATFYWAYKGAEINFLYTLLASLFGTNNHPSTIIAKVCIDQFVYNPFFNIPFTIVLYTWKEMDFDFKKTKSQLTWLFIKNRFISIAFSTWMVWIPTVAMVYALPALLQVPFFNVILCFWVLLLSILTSQKKEIVGRVTH